MKGVQDKQARGHKMKGKGGGGGNTKKVEKREAKGVKNTPN